MKIRRLLSAALVVVSMTVAIPLQAGFCMNQKLGCCSDHKSCKKSHMDCCKGSAKLHSCTYKKDCCGDSCGMPKKAAEPSQKPS
jgi:hypothetical protein